MARELRLLSLFSGCGGMDLGFEGGFEVHRSMLTKQERSRLEGEKWYTLPRTSFKTVFANDILEGAAIAWRNYFSKREGRDVSNIYHLDSVVDLVERHRHGEEIFPQNIDILTGGFPCQDFSLSGKRRGFASHRDHKGQLVDRDEASVATRGQLYMWMKEVIEIVQPKVFVAENVKGLVNMQEVKETIERDFASMSDGGYHVFEPRVLLASNYGVPQSRERVFFIGVKKSSLIETAKRVLLHTDLSAEYDPYPLPTYELSDSEKCCLADIFEGLEEPHLSTDPSQQYYSKAKYMGVHCQGQKEINLLGIAPTIRAEHHGNIEFRRLSLEHGGRYRRELELGLGERRLTPRECALIQSFPKDYPFVIPYVNSSRRFRVSASMAYKIIGNAVPPLFAYRIAQRLEELWPSYFIE